MSELATAGGTISFVRLAERLPLPLPPTARPIRFLVQFDETLNRDLLTVRGLTAPGYALSIDGEEVARLSSAALNEGVNLTAWESAPEYVQAKRAMEAIHARNLAEIGYWRSWIFSGKADGNGQPLASATETERQAMEAVRQEVARLEEAVPPLVRTVPHRYTLTPLETAPSRYDELVSHPFNAAQLKASLRPVRVDWNRQVLLDTETTLTIVNPGPVARRVTVTWETTPQWQASTGAGSIEIEAGATLKVPVTLALKEGAEALPPPSCRLTWRWHDDWPYPLEASRELPVQPVLTIAHLAALPTIDGDLADAEPATASMLDQACRVAPAVPGKRRVWRGPADLSARLFLAWHEDGLYLAARVRDDVHRQEHRGSPMWSQDMLHVAAWTRLRGAPDGNYEFGFGMPASGPEWIKYRSTVKEVAGPPVQFAGKVLEGGECTYEILIPWAHLAPLTAAAGAELRFSLSVNDADTQPGKGFTYIEWTGGINYGKNPNDLGHLVLGAP